MTSLECVSLSMSSHVTTLSKNQNGPVCCVSCPACMYVRATRKVATGNSEQTGTELQHMLQVQLALCATAAV